MTAAVITASASVLVAVLAFILNQRAQLAMERRRARLDRIADQLRRLYGPLHALVNVNEDLWRRLREGPVPGQDQRRSGAAMTPEQSQHWRTAVNSALMPINRTMRDLIIEHADLLVETDLPEPLRDFCAHVAAYEVVLAAEDVGVARAVLIHHPGGRYADYVRATYTALKAEQAALLERNARRRRSS